MAVYELMPEERLVAMMEYRGVLIIATTHRLFEMWEGWNEEETPKKEFKIKPILMEVKDANAED